jgi:hypothetical protein
MSRTSENRERWKRQILDALDAAGRPLPVRDLREACGPDKPFPATVVSVARELVDSGEARETTVVADVARGSRWVSHSHTTRPKAVRAFTTTPAEEPTP